MSNVSLTVHRATDQIGGNCIELAAGDERIVLDVGRPLDAPRNATGLLPASLDLTAPISGVLISHPHQDHYGLLDELPAHWPVHCGAATAELITITTGLFGSPTARPFHKWRSGKPTEIGAFRVTPMLTDHSAFDAHMLLIEIEGRRVLYSGDFRTHGRKAALVQRLMDNPPADLDLLLMEGTNLGSDKPCISESDLEAEFAALFRNTPGRVFVAWSAQNIDRTVTIYRSCLRSGRSLVIDLYTAEVLEKLSSFGRIPQPDWRSIKVVISRNMALRYKRRGEGAFVDRMAANGISAKALAERERSWVIMIRPSLIADYEAAGVVPAATDAWSWSMWRGYLDNADGQRLRGWFGQGGAAARHIHTSGHAAPADLRAFAGAMKPKALVPIHGVAWDSDADGFPPIVRLKDGQPYVVP